jgi:hypothetical protein
VRRTGLILGMERMRDGDKRIPFDAALRPAPGSTRRRSATV